MKNEKYRAKSPRHIFMADVTYFEGNGNDLEEYDLIDYQPPPEFQLGILLEKNWDPFLANSILSMISLYFTPEQYLDRCLNLEAFPWCGRSQQVISVENVRYRIIVDERRQNVETGEEGEWVLYQEYYSYNEGSPKLCAVHIGFIVPDHETFEGMRNRICSLFEEVASVEPQKLSGKEERIEKANLER